MYYLLASKAVWTKAPSAWALKGVSCKCYDQIKWESEVKVSTKSGCDEVRNLILINSMKHVNKYNDLVSSTKVRSF